MANMSKIDLKPTTDLQETYKKKRVNYLITNNLIFEKAKKEPKKAFCRSENVWRVL